MILKEFKGTIQELGFEKGKIIGVWCYSKKLLPENDIEVVHFTKGDFWVNKIGQRVFSSNYKVINLDYLVEELIKIINNT